MIAPDGVRMTLPVAIASLETWRCGSPPAVPVRRKNERNESATTSHELVVTCWICVKTEWRSALVSWLKVDLLMTHKLKKLLQLIGIRHLYQQHVEGAAA